MAAAIPPIAIFTLGKRIERRSFCETNNQQMMCGTKPGECATCVK